MSSTHTLASIAIQGTLSGLIGTTLRQTTFREGFTLGLGHFLGNQFAAYLVNMDKDIQENDSQFIQGVKKIAKFFTESVIMQSIYPIIIGAETCKLLGTPVTLMTSGAVYWTTLAIFFAIVALNENTVEQEA